MQDLSASVFVQYPDYHRDSSYKRIRPYDPFFTHLNLPCLISNNQQARPRHAMPFSQAPGLQSANEWMAAECFRRVLGFMGSRAVLSGCFCFCLSEERGGEEGARSLIHPSVYPCIANAEVPFHTSYFLLRSPSFLFLMQPYHVDCRSCCLVTAKSSHLLPLFPLLPSISTRRKGDTKKRPSNPFSSLQTICIYIYIYIQSL